MLSLILVSILFGVWLAPSLGNDAVNSGSTTCDERALGLGDNVRPSEAMLPTYWINLLESQERRKVMVQYLKESHDYAGIGHHKRILAVTPDSLSYNLTRLEKPCKRNSPSDLAIIMSHLTAMRTAVYDRHKLGGEQSYSDYALILEDDIEFTFRVDLRRVVSQAPKDFGILQLMTSNVEAINELQEKYFASKGTNLWTLNHWTNTTGNGKYARYWGALGYIINKRVVKSFLDDVVHHDPVTGRNSYKIINSFSPDRCKRTRERPCVLANCLFSDTYIYSGAGPTYVFHIPLLTSGKRRSTSHESHIEAHTTAFKRIDEIVAKVKKSAEDSKACEKK